MVMARLAGKLCFVSAALRGAAALDSEALFQKEVRSHAGGQATETTFASIVAEQFPGMEGLKVPSLPPPSMEEIFKMASQALQTLRNDTVVQILLSGMDDVNALVAKTTSSMEERFAVFNASAHQLATEDVLPLAVNFMEAEIDMLKPQMHEFIRTMVSIMKTLPLDKKGLQAKMMIAMAEPFLMQGMSDALRPLKESIEAMGNKSTRAFCEGALPIVINSSATVAPLRTAEVELKKAMQQLPAMQSSPWAFMMADVVPKVVKLGQKMLDGSRLIVTGFDSIATQLNTTFRYALNERLDCDVVIRSGAAPKGLGILAAVASAVAWLLL